MAAVESLCLGKPIEILGQSVVQHWQNQFGFKREEMLEHIAWSQFIFSSDFKRITEDRFQFFTHLTTRIPRADQPRRQNRRC